MIDVYRHDGQTAFRNKLQQTAQQSHTVRAPRNADEHSILPERAGIEAGAKQIRMACLLASPEGISKFHGHHPGVHVWTAAVDEQLNDHGYILPGLGDAGDRMYGTR